MGECKHCGGALEQAFRYCPWCAAPQRLKLTDLFAGSGESDAGRALRVSRYLDAETQHVRFSIWNEDGVAVAALSLDADEARRLRAFLGLEPVKRRPDFLRRIRSYS